MRRLILVIPLAGCMPLATNWPGEQSFDVRTADVLVPAPEDPASVRVVTWNLKYGWGRNDIFFDGWDDAVEIEAQAVYDVLDKQIALLEQLEADLVFTQETDVDSRRSQYIDQVDYILQNSHFNHAAYVPIWDAEYVAQSGLGPTEMGQVVFSRWPISENTRIDQPVSKSDPGYVRYFAPKRAIQRAVVELPTPLTVLNVHPTAYSLDGTKQVHLAQIFDVAEAVEGPVVVGGDFNVIPPGSVNMDRFDDNTDAGVEGVTEVTYSDEEIAALDPFYAAYEPVVPLADYQAGADALDPGYDQAYADDTCSTRDGSQKRFFSHSLKDTVFWNQKLDYLFTDLSWGGGGVVQCPGDQGITLEPMQLSDHAPVVGTLVLRGGLP